MTESSLLQYAYFVEQWFKVISIGQRLLWYCFQSCSIFESWTMASNCIWSAFACFGKKNSMKWTYYIKKIVNVWFNLHGNVFSEHIRWYFWKKQMNTDYKCFSSTSRCSWITNFRLWHCKDEVLLSSYSVTSQ